MSEPISEEARAYMRALGSRVTPAKTAAARRNIERANAARRRDPLDFPCLCGLCPDAPKWTCPRGRLLKQREQAAARSTEKSQRAEQGLATAAGTTPSGPVAPAVGTHEAAARRLRELQALMEAPASEREVALEASAQAATAFYDSPEGRAEWEEMADWRALDGLPFEEEGTHERAA